LSTKREEAEKRKQTKVRSGIRVRARNAVRRTKGVMLLSLLADVVPVMFEVGLVTRLV